MPSEFRNEPFTDFTKEENAAAMRAAIAKVQSELGREYPLVIGGERIKTGDFLESINPANRTQVVGRFNKANKGLANRAVPLEQLDAAVTACTDQLTMLSAAALAVAKKAIYAWDSVHFDKGLARAEKIYLEELLKTRDTREGIEAFLQKRKPQWTGR